MTESEFNISSSEVRGFIYGFLALLIVIFAVTYAQGVYDKGVESGVALYKKGVEQGILYQRSIQDQQPTYNYGDQLQPLTEVKGNK